MSRYTDAVLADAPIGYWKMNDVNYGGSVADSSGHGYSGSVDGLVEFGQDGATPLLGSAVNFGSGRGSIIAPALDGHLPTGGQPYSIELWAKVAPSQFGAFVFWGDYVYNDSTTHAFNALILDNSYNLRAYWSGHDFFVYGTSLLYPQNFDAWHHIAVTCDGTTDALYVDGTQVASQAAYNSGWAGHNFRIGAFLNGLSLQNTAFVQHVAVYDHALGRDRLALHYAAAFPYPNAILGAAPVAYWPLSEGTGQTYADIGGNGYDVSATPVQSGVSGPFSGTKAVRFTGGGAVGGTQTTLSAQQPFTVDAWVKVRTGDPRADTSQNWMIVLAWGDVFNWTWNIPGYGAASVVQVRANTGQTEMFVSHGSDQSSSTDIIGSWHHLAWTVGTGTSANQQAYIGGVGLGLGSYGGPGVADASAGVFRIGGADGWDALGWFDLAYVALYPSALSGTRIAAHAAATTDSGYRSAVLADAPSAFWPLQEI